MQQVWVISWQNAHIADTLHIRHLGKAMTLGVSMCRVYPWTVHVQHQCTLYQITLTTCYLCLFIALDTELVSTHPWSDSTHNIRITVYKQFFSHLRQKTCHHLWLFVDGCHKIYLSTSVIVTFTYVTQDPYLHWRHLQSRLYILECPRLRHTEPLLLLYIRNAGGPRPVSSRDRQTYGTVAWQ